MVKSGLEGQEDMTAVPSVSQYHLLLIVISGSSRLVHGEEWP